MGRRRKYELSKEANEKLKKRELSRKIYKLKKRRYLETDKEVAIFLLEEIERGHKVNYENKFFRYHSCNNHSQ